MTDNPRVLIVEARFYEDIADALARGAIAALEAEAVAFDRICVPGALEIPAAIQFAARKYDGFVALGCVIRGETSHYDIVAGESARGLMDLSIRDGLCIGNGILTCETRIQALERALPEKKNKGRAAALAALAMAAHKVRFAKGE
ncbi:MAG: 6,7-dimethyl-8-ribityllumazine synthase [Rhodospirillales bacterium]|nr:6,7-dimethyl-8-ribityllumazine synthase [Alphaproteobacteria bacterium]MCB9980782.1 6,7-dimethyl-8-ribityllumazine synthase [Rhodospirillales bacterium]